MKTIDKYPEFTKAAIEATYDRNYLVYYRTKGMEKSEYFYTSTKEQVNVDPTKQIVPRRDRALSHLGIADICKRFRLYSEFLLRDPDLKIMIVDTRGFRYPDEVMAIGENGKWRVRENYRGVLETYLIGPLPDIKFIKAA